MSRTADEAERFQALAARLADPTTRRFHLAELADYLRVLPTDAFRRAVADAPRAELDAAALNQLAGGVELAAARRGQEPPWWTRAVPPASRPTFGSALASVRLHLLTRAPVALRRRNLFADASFDERVQPRVLSAARIRELFDLLANRLAGEGVVGELYVVGGAVMALAFAARPATHDVDAVFVPTDVVRRLAREIAEDAGVDEGWLNDAVKGFLSPRGDFVPWLELAHLKVFVAAPEYLLAMKCVAFRLGPEFHDEDDVRFLLGHLGITRAADALAVVERYFPPERVPPKTRYALEELLGG